MKFWSVWPQTAKKPTLFLTMALHATKSALRKDILSKVASMAPEERDRQSEVVQTALLNSKAFKTSRHISVYLSLPKEVCTQRIVETILAGMQLS
jgi:5-formyltetrahydrofolate cyclo-ligase